MIEHAEVGALWARWAALSGRTVAARRRRAFPNTALCVEAAAAGMGAALVERRLAADDIARGRLVAPCGFATVPGGFAAVLRAPSRGASAFLDWVAALAN